MDRTTASSQSLTTIDGTPMSFGVEIETIGATRERAAKTIQAIVGGTASYVGGTYDAWKVVDANSRTWMLCTDSSLSADRSLQAEIVTPILTHADIDTLQTIVRAVREAGAKVDASCGLHIHVSHPSVTPKALANLAKLVYKQEALIYKALGVNERRMRQYCKPMERDFIERIDRKMPATMYDLNKAWYGSYRPNPSRYDTSRYHIVNLNGFFLRGAVEFRAYSGSLHAGKIKAAILFSMALFARALTCRCASAKQRPYLAASAKYDMRVFLIGALNMNGDDFKTAREHLLALMPGDAAWKNGRPTTAAAG